MRARGEQLFEHGVEGSELPQLGRNPAQGLADMVTQRIDHLFHPALQLQMALAVGGIARIGLRQLFDRERVALDGLGERRSHALDFLFDGLGPGRTRIRRLARRSRLDRLDRLVRRLQSDGVECVHPQAQPLGKVHPGRLRIHGRPFAQQANKP